MHIYQGERDLREKNQALAIPSGFQVDKEIAISSEQLSQVWISVNITLEHIIINVQFVVVISLGKYSLQICFGEMV